MYKLIITTLLVTVSSTNYAGCNKSLPRTAPDNLYELLNNNTEVKDKETGLIWQRCSLGQTWSGTACTGTAATYNWTNALQTAKNMGNGWRVPNIKELDSLIEQACYSPSINEVFFPNTQSGSYWSSSPFTGVDFTFGSVGGSGFNGANLYVRLVRSE